jgi:hypothetical protein
LALAACLTAASCVLGDGAVEPRPERLAPFPDLVRLTLSERVATFRLIAAPVAGGAEWTVEEKPPWVSLSPSGGVLTGSDVTVTTTAEIAATMEPGTYLDTLVLASPGLTPARIALTLTVPPQPVAEMSPTTSFIAEDRDTVSVRIRNAGHGDMEWKLEPTVLWVRASPDTGRISSGGEVTVILSAERDSLVGAGAHDIDLILRWRNVATTSLHTASGSVTVAVPPRPKLRVVTPPTFAAGLTTRLVDFGSVGNTAVSWTVHSKPAWLTLSATSGTIDRNDLQRLRMSVDPAAAPTDGSEPLILAINSPVKGRDTVAISVSTTLSAAGDVRLLSDHPFGTSVVDAAFARVTGKLLTVDQSQRFIITDIVTGEADSVALPFSPWFGVATRPDGRFAAIRSFDAVAIIDLLAARIDRTVPVQGDGRLIYLPNNFVYVIEWDPAITAINAATGEISEHQNPGMQWNPFRSFAGSPVANVFYTEDAIPGPGQIIRRRWMMAADGAPSVAWEKTNDNVNGTQLWMNDAGSRLINSAAQVYSASSTQAEDLNHLGALATGFHVASFTEIASRSRYYAIDGTPGLIKVINSTSLAADGTLGVPAVPTLSEGSDEATPVHVFSTAQGRLHVLMTSQVGWAWWVVDAP